ncbi:hypothetical protein ACOSQ2_003717 [Xanthoceras sorbifolium]
MPKHRVPQSLNCNILQELDRYHLPLPSLLLKGARTLFTFGHYSPLDTNTIPFSAETRLAMEPSRTENLLFVIFNVILAESIGCYVLINH